MKRMEHTFQMDCYPSLETLSASDQELLLAAKKATVNAYVPYSGFKVGAALALEDGIVVTGSNQENASFPAGICAERVALSAASSQYPNAVITAIALSFKSATGPDDHPISPCGICRQTLVEYEQKQLAPIRVLLGGQTGMVYAIASVAELLPLTFTAEDLKSS